MKFKKKNTILILGASGYLGSWLVKSFHNSYNLILIQHKEKQCPPMITNTISLTIDNFFNSELKFEIDVFINASIVYKPENSLAPFIDCNVHLPFKILEKISKAEDFLFIQFDSFYSKFFNKSVNISPYLLSKQNMLDWCKLFNIKSNSTTIVLRIEHLIGPNETRMKFNGRLIKDLKNNKDINLSHCEQKLDFIHIKDIVNVVEILIEKRRLLKGQFKLFEVGTGKNYPLIKLILVLKEKLNSSSKLNFGKAQLEDYKLMDSKANNKPLKEMGWKPKYDFNRIIDSIT